MQQIRKQNLINMHSPLIILLGIVIIALPNAIKEGNSRAEIQLSKDSPVLSGKDYYYLSETEKEVFWNKGWKVK